MIDAMFDTETILPVIKKYRGLIDDDASMGIDDATYSMVVLFDSSTNGRMFIAEVEHYVNGVESKYDTHTVIVLDINWVY